jgi:hypothetical protein
MALQTLTIGPADDLPKTYATTSVTAADGLAVTVNSDSVGELYAWGTSALTLTVGGGAAVPLPSQSHAYEVPVRVWVRCDSQDARSSVITIKSASGTATVYLLASPRATGV